MSPVVVEILQYGALGLLTLAMLGAYRLLNRAIDKIATIFDKLSEALENLGKEVTLAANKVDLSKIEIRAQLNEHEATEKDRLTEFRDDIIVEIRALRAPQLKGSTRG